MINYEKLGVFYLGKEYDLASKQVKEDLILYDSRDLVTHAVVVGMTGSGKTGLCIGLIEEAAIDGVPSILIDPKGDLTNLLLTFPNLSAEDFLPWVNPDDAKRKELTPEAYAAQQAQSWKKGLADWGQDGMRIQRLRESADFVVFTPGSSAGVQVSILKSFAAPPIEVMEDSELFNERVTSTATSLLGLIGIDADPLQSREHILLSNILSQAWQKGQDLDIATLITQIQNPPLTRIGVLDLESFYPSKERFGLVMALNNLLASPGFSTWMEGVPLDIGQILHTPQGKPRVSIFSIAHLGDAERMFFVSLLLNQVLGWMRSQPGTTSLRALVYMDEIFGYFPPTSNPPTKLPLLTLLKQARAFGVGVVLATQNPVDLDYKGLANAGTWFIGRMQTERDKARVMDGLEGAALAAGSPFNRANMDKIISGLGNRIFLMNNVHEDQPVVFTTRWVMSYLRGPLTRMQIKQLMDPYKALNPLPVKNAQPAAAAPAAAVGSQPAVQSAAGFPAVQSGVVAAPPGQQPMLPADISQFFIPARGSGSGLTYLPVLVGAARVRYSEAKARVDTTEDVLVMTPITEQAVAVDWNAAQALDIRLNDLERSPVRGATFESLPQAAARAKNYTDWGRDFSAWVYANQKLELLRSPGTGKVSEPGERERDFRIRLQQVSREQRDDAVNVVKKKYAPKLAALEEKVRRAQQAVEREAEQANQARTQSAISFGSTLLNALTGRKLLSSSSLNKAATAARGVGRAVQQGGDVKRAKDTVEKFKQDLAELNAEFEQEMEAAAARVDAMSEELETLALRPKKTDINVQLVTLAWAPYRNSTPAW